jgi:diguanylate cyclase (GGDEF)-like protein/PAS domain S-box-containing protein
MVADINMSNEQKDLTQINDALFNVVEGMGFMLDHQGVIFKVNDSALRILKLNKTQVIGKNISDLLFTDSREMQNAYREVATQTERQMDFQFEEKGQTYQINIVPVIIKEKDMLFIVKINNITENKKDEELLYRFQQMVSSVNNPIVFLDENLKIRSYNDSFLMLYRIPKENVISTKIKKVMGDKNFNKITNCIKTCFKGHHIFMNDWFVFSDGIKRYMQIDFHPLTHQEEAVTGIIISQNDVSERKIIEEKLERLNQTDSLTGIYNRKKFNESLNFEIGRLRRYKNAMSIVMFDIDHFKKINDTHGHDVGDSVLIELTKVVAGIIRDTDMFFRWGGEEFMILLPHTSLKSAAVISHKLRQNIELHKFSKVNKVTCSFGVTEFLEKDDEKIFCKRVDIALYEAKKGGRNRVEFK